MEKACEIPAPTKCSNIKIGFIYLLVKGVRLQAENGKMSRNLGTKYKINTL